MKRFLKQAFIFVASSNIAIMSFVIVFFSTGNQVQLGVLGAFAGFLLSYWLLKRKLLPQDELDKVERKEKKYVLTQIKDAKTKLQN